MTPALRARRIAFTGLTDPAFSRYLERDAHRWHRPEPRQPHVARFVAWMLAQHYAEATERYQRPGARRLRVVAFRASLRSPERTASQ